MDSLVNFTESSELTSMLLKVAYKEEMQGMLPNGLMKPVLPLYQKQIKVHQKNYPLTLLFNIDANILKTWKLNSRRH